MIACAFAFADSKKNNQSP